MGITVNGVLYLPVFVCEGAEWHIRIGCVNGRYAAYCNTHDFDFIESCYYNVSNSCDELYGLYSLLTNKDDPSDCVLVCYLGPDGFFTREEVEGGVV